MQRDPAQIEHRQQVRVANFVLEAETDEIEILKWREGLQAVKRQAVLPQQGFEIEPGSESALASPLWIIVHDRVKDLQPVMAHAQAVGVGESQAKFAAHLAMILGHCIQFAPDIL